MQRDVLDYYATPGRFTTLALEHRQAMDVSSVVAVVQGLLIYDLFAKPFYDVDLTPTQAEAIHERDSAALLDLASHVDPRPITEPRPPASRVGGRCHAYSRLTVALLRAGGVPARARCGFGSYFVPGRLEDHWVAECWDGEARRWRRVDAQLDATWQEAIGFADDPFDLSESQFLPAGEAWRSWRRGDLDADVCGLTAIDEHGPHWIAGNLRLDLAALNKVEMLPWDVWGAGWEPGEEPTDELLDLFDTVAALTVAPDERFAGLRDRYDHDVSLRMDGTVFNVLRGRSEAV